MAAIRAAVHEAWEAEDLERLPRDERIELALRFFAEPCAEDKLAGVLALAERLLPELTAEDLPRLARPLADGSIDDWSTCDWYCVKVLGRLVESAPEPRVPAEAIAEWRYAERLWHRRAAAVSFVNLASKGDRFFPGFTALLLDVCAANVRDPARFSQTSVGWLLRELSHGEPDAVAAFVAEHADEMSTEARRTAVAKLPPETRPASETTRRSPRTEERRRSR